MATTQVDFPSALSHRFNGPVSFRTVTLPAASVSDSNVATNAGIDATKVIHQHAIRYVQNAGADVTSATSPVHVFRGAADIVAVEVVPLTAPTGGDKAFTVDVKLGNAGDAFASILSGVVTVNSSSAARTIQAGSLSTTTAEDGDTLEVVIAASGSTGSQGQGVIVVVWVREEP